MPSTSKLNSLAKDLAGALKSFAESPSTFRVVRSIHSRQDKALNDDSAWSGSAPDRLYVLDSSFNPPTRGHLAIALSALRADAGADKHMLLLLATQNADKASKPAAFELRLAMMDVMARSLIEALKAEATAGSSSAEPALTVHIGVTKHPYFIDKSRAIAGDLESSSTSGASSAGESSESPFRFPPTRQTHLIGFDTLTRLMDPKYYGPERSLKPLAPLFADHTVRVTLRTDDGYGDRDDQTRYVDDIAAGKREGDGADKSWAEKVQLVDGVNAEGATSSTRAREAAKAGDEDTLVKMCGGEVARYVLEEGLYRDG